MTVDDQPHLRSLAGDVTARQAAVAGAAPTRRMVRVTPPEWADFRLATVRLAEAGANTHESWARASEAADILLRMAIDDAPGLRAALRPDPLVPHAIWTVACYQIGDFTPSSLHDFMDPQAAVSALAHCDDRSHVAAELVASTSDGVRWTSLTRTGDHIAFQLFAPPSDEDHRSEPAWAAASAHWSDRLERWADPIERQAHAWDPSEAVPEELPDDLAALGLGGAYAPGTAEQLEQLVGGSVVGIGVVLGQILEVVRSVDARLAAGQQASAAALAASSERVEAIERRLAHVERLLPAPLAHVTRWWVDAPRREHTLVATARTISRTAPAVAAERARQELNQLVSGRLGDRLLAGRALLVGQGKSSRLAAGRSRRAGRHFLS